MSTIQPPEVRHADKPAGKVALPRIWLAALLGMLATAALLGVVSATAGLGAVGWITGLVTGSAAAALLVTARRRSDQPAIFPADWVTLTRMLLIAGVTGLVADSFSRPVSITALVTLSAVALALDAVDGQVARRTGTATPLGARIDGETDAFLILVLSIAVSQDYGGWVLVIGAARYVFLLAGWLIPWLPAPLPPRYWRKVVAAIQGIVLTVAASGVTSRLVGMIAVAVALLLLAESFGRDVYLALPHRRQPAHPPGSADRRHRACARGPVVRPLGARPYLAVHPRRFCPHPRRTAGPGGGGAGAAALATTDRGHHRRAPLQPAHARQDPQHGVLRGGRPVVQPGERLGQHPARP